MTKVPVLWIFLGSALVAFQLGGCKRTGAPAPVEWGYQQSAPYSSALSRKTVTKVSTFRPQQENPSKKSFPEQNSSSPLKREDIQIIEIHDSQEKVLPKKEDHKVEDFEIVEFNEKSKAEVFDEAPKPLHKPSLEESKTPDNFNDETVPDLPVPASKPLSQKEEPVFVSEKEPMPKSLSDEGVPRPSRKPKFLQENSSSASIASRQSQAKKQIEKEPVVVPSEDRIVSKSHIKKRPNQKDAPSESALTPVEVIPADNEEESLFWEEEKSSGQDGGLVMNQDSPPAQPQNIEPSRTSALPSTFSWPLKGKILKGFSRSGKQGRNDGLNIAGEEGDPVQAARQGQVVYVGNELHGFGHLILIKHDDEWMSAYAHLGQVRVQRGDMVRRSQVIATVGSSGSVSRPQLHFEVRRRSQPVDPKRFLE